MRIPTLGRLLGAVCAAALALPAAAQNDIRAGQTVTGRLDSSDSRLDDGSYYEVWNYRGRAGEHLTITLRSTQFDAYLAFGRLSGGECQDECETDDDGGGGTDARVEVTLERDGVYGIRVNTLSGGETGSYTLSVASGAAPPRVSAVPRPIRTGQTVSSRLDDSDARSADDSFYELWTYRGRPGERIVVTLKSTDFDAYLSWGRMSGGEFDEMDSDDDGGGGTDARLEVTLGDAGEYLIRANTLSEGETGSYTLTVEPATGAAPAPRGGGAAAAVDLTRAQPISAGQTVRGRLDGSDPTLDDDSHYDLYTYTGRAGERLVITLASSDFDTFLALGRVVGGAFEEVDTNDDGEEGTDSVLEVTLPAGGTYVIRANSLAGGATGAYTLSVRGR